jgi:integrase/recombinase XerC
MLLLEENRINFHGDWMALGKQAKILTDKQIRAVLAELDTRRYRLRDRVMFLLSFKAGLRAKEVASVTWAMVTDAEGEIANMIALENRASKGRGGGRHIPIHLDLKAALIALHRDRSDRARPDMPIIHSERDRGLSAAAVVVWFHRLYADLGMVGCSSHSGRRSFITRAARKISEVGGSLRDVQQLAGHASLGTTARYIECDADAQQKVVALI